MSCDRRYDYAFPEAFEWGRWSSDLTFHPGLSFGWFNYGDSYGDNESEKYGESTLTREASLHVFRSEYFIPCGPFFSLELFLYLTFSVVFCAVTPVPLVTKRRSSRACIGNPKPEEETIKGTHAQETSAYQCRPTTQHAAQGSKPVPLLLRLASPCSTSFSVVTYKGKRACR